MPFWPAVSQSACPGGTCRYRPLLAGLSLRFRTTGACDRLSYLCLGAPRALTGYRSAVRRNAPPRSDVDVVPSGGASDADVVDVTPRRGRRRLQSDAPAVAPDRGPAFEPQLPAQSASIGPERPRGVEPPLWPQDPGVLRPLAEELGRSAPATPHELWAEAAAGPGTVAEAGPAATAPAEGRGGRRGRASRRRRRVVGEESSHRRCHPLDQSRVRCWNRSPGGADANQLIGASGRRVHASRCRRRNPG